MTHTITGTETISIHNNSPQAPNDVCRLDHDTYRPVRNNVWPKPPVATDAAARFNRCGV
jgi:hypothetical protein